MLYKYVQTVKKKKKSSPVKTFRIKNKKKHTNTLMPKMRT